MRYTIETKIYVESDLDPEQVAADMNDGLGPVLMHFPSGEVTGAKVELIREANDDEVASYFEE